MCNAYPCDNRIHPETEWFNNNKPCPVCGSDMIRESSDSPHDIYIEHRVCTNIMCGVSKTFIN